MDKPHGLAGRKPANTRDTEATLDDLRFLAAHHVGAHEAARRLGFASAHSLEKWLHRRQRTDLYARLRRHDPLPLHGVLHDHVHGRSA